MSDFIEGFIFFTETDVGYMVEQGKPVPFFRDWWRGELARTFEPGVIVLPPRHVEWTPELRAAYEKAVAEHKASFA